jgi:hypothetical protein
MPMSTRPCFDRQLWQGRRVGVFNELERSAAALRQEEEPRPAPSRARDAPRILTFRTTSGDSGGRLGLKAGALQGLARHFGLDMKRGAEYFMDFDADRDTVRESVASRSAAGT